MNKRKAIQYIGSLINNMNPWKKNYPTILSYLVTNQCNSHCITCNIWRNTNITTINLEALEKITSGKLFSKIKQVGISGGEPTVFLHLIDHIKILLKLPKIRTISITTNCINADYIIDNVYTIYSLCNKSNVYFQINLSLDGIGRIHDKIRGTKYNFSSFEKVLNFLKKKSIPFQIHSTIDRYNVYHVNSLLEYAKYHRINIIFRLASEIRRLNNRELIEKVSLNKKQTSFFCDFLASKNLLENTPSPGRRLFYKYLKKQLLLDGKRSSPCSFKNNGIVLSSEGLLSHCSRFENHFSDIYTTNNFTRYFREKNKNEAFTTNTCLKCYHDQTGIWKLSQVINELYGNNFNVLKKCFVIVLDLIRCSFCIKKKEHNEDMVQRVSIIGMYGGEHVGDAAILGGVIVRMLKLYPNIDHIYLYSFRKDRTECWVDNLSESIRSKIHVIGQRKSFIEYIMHSQMLIWAGGPLMDIPSVLTRNYYFITKAKSVNCKIRIEGIGYGPLNSHYSKWISGKIIKSADNITVRTSDDFNKLKQKYKIDLTPGLRDPAFDYLSSIQNEIYINTEEKKIADSILSGIEGHKVIALNLRPLWNKYGKSDYFSFDDFLDQLILSLNYFLERDFIIIFFPMNSDQFGFSDLEIAYKVQRKLQNYNNFRILETEPTINQLIYIIRNVDVAICMRFHAVIFCLSQEIRTIGLDYSLTDLGKVSSLLKDRENDLCLNIRNFSKEKLIEFINKKTISN